MTSDSSSIDHVQLVMGTGVRIALRGVRDEREAHRALEAASTWLQHVDAVFSTYKPDSAVTRLREDRFVEVEDLEVVEEVIERCELALRRTRGAFDPWAVPGGFDPSGLVKGWSLERVGELLAPVCTGFLVDAGGDLLVKGRPEDGRDWTVGIRHPLDEESVACVLDMHGTATTAVATSGGYARGDHLIDPHSGKAAQGILSATVVGPDAGLADALATALYVLGVDGLDIVVDLADYEAFVIDQDRRTWATPGLPLQSAA